MPVNLALSALVTDTPTVVRQPSRVQWDHGLSGFWLCRALRYYFPQAFIRRDVLEQMLSAGEAINCEQGPVPRSWGGFSKSAPLRASTSARLSAQFFRSWMRFSPRVYRSFPPRPPDRGVFGKLTSSHHALTGTSAFVPDPLVSGGGFHLRYNGADRVTLSDEPQPLAVLGPQ